MSNQLVLVLNCGSSSLKFSIINPINEKTYISGCAECLNLPDARIKWEVNLKKTEKKLSINSSHSEALNFIIEIILTHKKSLISKLIAIGHRIVHGGNKVTQSSIINKDILKIIEDSVPFAPLHNPSNLIGIYESFKAFPKFKKKNVAVFDTAFHQTIPPESYIYAIPYFLYKKYGIRRYGAHGISHYYVSKKAAKILKKPINQINIITCHLGNGGSVAAIKGGKCVDTSMGLTPLEGLVMGTRSGDIDPAIIFYLHDILGWSISRINIVLTKKSGLLGLTNITSDCRYLEDNYDENHRVKLAINIYCHRLSKYIAAYSTLMEDTLDALVFTGGIGENSAIIREKTLKKLKLLGFQIDISKNLFARFGNIGVITTKKSRLAMVIPTNEELVIAQESAHLVM